MARAPGTADLFALSDVAPALATADPQQWAADASWQEVLAAFWGSATGQGLRAYLAQRLAQGTCIYPPEPLRALTLTPLSQVRVVILGQDPYHGPGQAEGLAFSVAPGVKVPPSLRNIYKELQRDLGMAPPAGGSLVGWARQGVLLLNTCLTVEQGLPASHAKRGWEVLTDALLVAVAQQARACVYLLWGGHAQAKAPLIQAAAAQRGGQALILTANHPSPLSALRPPAPFIGCGHFSQAQSWLAERDLPVHWTHL
ncbi:MAG: uracil-DNA glycosylase [Limnohabitans sp.]|jgi:uracil-DNA glycosylase|nr:uracil-DNA glycosylase [Limnohabitans sp.]